ncbi:MAG: hypothetical protein ACK4HF_18155 [Paracoccaceae bacterium]
MAFSVLIITISAQTPDFSASQRSAISRLTPLTLAMPVINATIGVPVTGVAMTLRIMIGMARVLAGGMLVQRSGRQT